MWPIARAAERYNVSWPTAKPWADRYRDLDEAGMADRSSRRRTQPSKTLQPLGAAGEASPLPTAVVIEFTARSARGNQPVGGATLGA